MTEQRVIQESFPATESPEPHSPDIPDPDTPDREGWRPLVLFQARGIDFFWIVLRNLFFIILTLGVYSFWARVRNRVFLWRSTRILGDPLEYTGTGKELFISFLIVMGFLLVLILIQFMSLALLPSRAAVTQTLLYVGLLYALHFAIYRSIRFRLTRTRWRGIRGNLDGSAAKYALKAFAYTWAVIGTLGILGPWCTSRLVSFLMNNTLFGNRRFSFNGPPRELYFAYFLVMLVSFALIGTGAFIIFSVFSSIDAAAITNAKPDPDALLHVSRTFILVYVVLAIALILVSTMYQAAFTRWLFGHLSFGAMRLRSTLTAGALFKLYLGNILLLACTLGLAYPWVRLRSLRLPLNCIAYQGAPDLERLLQDTMPAPKRGEGFLEAMDIDIGM